MTTPHNTVSSIVESLSREFTYLNEPVLTRYLEDIVSWNRRVPLVSRKTTSSALERLVRQSIRLREYISELSGLDEPFEKRNIVDIGTGAGFPGVIWKILEPRASITLIERNHKKATFLMRTATTLGLSDLAVVERDALEASTSPDLSNSFDLAVTFAVGDPKWVVPFVDNLLEPGGLYATLRPLEERGTPIDMGRGMEFADSRRESFGNFCLYRKSFT
jgi:16S rRNA (guanine527-N7)-methyltransferase